MPGLPPLFNSLFLPLLVGFILLAFTRKFLFKTKISLMIVVVVLILFGSFCYLIGYYARPAQQKCEDLDCPTPGVKSDQTQSWQKLSEEVEIRGMWDTGDYKFDENTFCSRDISADFATMWRLYPYLLLFGRLRMKFYILDHRADKTKPLYFQVIQRLKDPSTGLYILPISQFSTPVDGVTERAEFKRFSKYSKKLEYYDGPGELQQPVEPGTQVEISLDQTANGNFLSQYYEILYNPVGESDVYVPMPFMYSIDELPFANFDGVQVQLGLGVSIGACIQDFEYYVE